MWLAGIVLLAACANLGSLFAARTADRTREIAIRMAIGSSRWRVVRQILVEAFVISILGGICACGLAWIALTGLATWHPPTDYPIQFFVMPQPSLILMAFLVSVLACVLFGLMPLRQIFQADPNDAIKGTGSQAVAGAPAGRFVICSGSADRALLRHRHGCFRRAARPGQSTHHGHGFQPAPCDR